jgi:molybdopterin molybdotransferase
VSALVVYEVLVRQALGWAAGVPPVPRPRLELPVTRSLGSRPGREDYVRCAVERTPAGLVARPVLGKSGLISTLIRADGLIRIPESTGGYSAGDTVEVMLLRMEAAF